jgi:hypothetical protein
MCPSYDANCSRFCEDSRTIDLGSGCPEHGDRDRGMLLS